MCPSGNCEINGSSEIHEDPGEADPGPRGIFSAGVQGTDPIVGRLARVSPSVQSGLDSPFFPSSNERSCTLIGLRTVCTSLRRRKTKISLASRWPLFGGGEWQVRGGHPGYGAPRITSGERQDANEGLERRRRSGLRRGSTQFEAVH